MFRLSWMYHSTKPKHNFTMIMLHFCKKMLKMKHYHCKIMFRLSWMIRLSKKMLKMKHYHCKIMFRLSWMIRLCKKMLKMKHYHCKIMFRLSWMIRLCKKMLKMKHYHCKIMFRLCWMIRLCKKMLYQSYEEPNERQIVIEQQKFLIKIDSANNCVRIQTYWSIPPQKRDITNITSKHVSDSIQNIPLTSFLQNYFSIVLNGLTITVAMGN